MKKNLPRKTTIKKPISLATKDSNDEKEEKDEKQEKQKNISIENTENLISEEKQRKYSMDEEDNFNNNAKAQFYKPIKTKTKKNSASLTRGSFKESNFEQLFTTIKEENNPTTTIQGLKQDQQQQQGFEQQIGDSSNINNNNNNNNITTIPPPPLESKFIPIKNNSLPKKEKEGIELMTTKKVEKKEVIEPIIKLKEEKVPTVEEIKKQIELIQEEKVQKKKVQEINNMNLTEVNKEEEIIQLEEHEEIKTNNNNGKNNTSKIQRNDSFSSNNDNFINDNNIYYENNDKLNDEDKKLLITPLPTNNSSYNTNNEYSIFYNKSFPTQIYGDSTTVRDTLQYRPSYTAQNNFYFVQDTNQLNFERNNKQLLNYFKNSFNFKFNIPIVNIYEVINDFTKMKYFEINNKFQKLFLKELNIRLFNLEEILERGYNFINLEFIKNFTKKLTVSLFELHKYGINHNSILPKNIFCDKNGKLFILQLPSFYLNFELLNDEHYTYFSPEIFNDDYNNDYNENYNVNYNNEDNYKYSKQNDMFMFGTLLLRIITNEYIDYKQYFEDDNDLNIKEKINKLNIHDNFKNNVFILKLTEIALRCVDLNLENRLTIIQMNSELEELFNVTSLTQFVQVTEVLDLDEQQSTVITQPVSQLYANTLAFESSSMIRNDAVNFSLESEDYSDNLVVGRSADYNMNQQYPPPPSSFNVSQQQQYPPPPPSNSANNQIMYKSTYPPIPMEELIKERSISVKKEEVVANESVVIDLLKYNEKEEENDEEDEEESHSSSDTKQQQPLGGVKQQQKQKQGGKRKEKGLERKKYHDAPRSTTVRSSEEPYERKEFSALRETALSAEDYGEQSNYYYSSGKAKKGSAFPSTDFFDCFSCYDCSNCFLEALQFMCCCCCFLCCACFGTKDYAQPTNAITTTTPIIEKPIVVEPLIPRKSLEDYVMGEEKLKCYKIEKRLSDGASAIVLTVKEKSTEKIFVMKRFRQGLTNDFTRELDCLKSFNHEFIIKIHDRFTFLDNNTTNHVIIMEYCELGDLFKQALSFVPGGKQKLLKPLRFFKYAIQLFEAISYIHSLNYVHCDIKPQNILLTRDGKIKLADFGYTVKEKNSIVGGTIYYMPPEQQEGQPARKSNDIYSAACSLLEILFKKRINLKESSLDEIWEKQMNNKCFKKSTLSNKTLVNELIKIFKNCVALDFNWRINSAKEIANEFIKIRNAYCAEIIQKYFRGFKERKRLKVKLNNNINVR
ncbi:hypothetical protein ABK040_003774 [Willaertia magna]